MASSRRAGAGIRLGQANRLALGSDSAAEKPAKQNVNNTERECKRGQRGRERGVVAGGHCRLPACGINLSFCRFYALALLCSGSELQPPAPPPARFGVAVCFAAFRGCSSVALAVPVCVSVCVCAFVCIHFGLACNWRETLWIAFVLAPRSLTTFCVFYCSADFWRQSRQWNAPMP